MSTDTASFIISERSGRKSGQEIRFKCPSPDHEDENPSAYYNAEKRVWCCKACGAKGHENDLRELLGLERLSIESDSGRPPGIYAQRRGKLYVANWPYDNEDGNIVGYTARFQLGADKEVIPYFRFDGKKWNQKGPATEADRLYNRHLLSQRPDETVWICEGEKKADAIVSMGGLATTSQGGANAGHKADWNPLAGRKVKFWRDNDIAGIGYQKAVVEVLSRLKPAPSIKEIDVRKLDLPEKGDIIDWLKIHPDATLEDLESLPLVETKANTEQQSIEASSSGNSDWMEQLVFGKTGPTACDHNLITVFQNGDGFKGFLGYNYRTLEPSFVKKPPFTDGGVYPRPISESDVGRVVSYFQQKFNVTTSVNKVSQLLRPVTMDSKYCRQFDPVLDWIECLQWDKINRLETALIEHAGAKDNPYTRLVFRYFLIGAVARTFKPGCKCDSIPIFMGEQGIRKSSLFRGLCPDDKYFSDHLPSLKDKDARAQLHGLLMLEIAELEAFGKAETSAIKSFITAQIDRFRPPYGRTPENFPRTMVFCGSTNSDDFLKDETGARRFWPVETKHIDVHWFRENRDPLWAEAAYLFKAGEKWWFDADGEKLQKTIAEDYRECEAWEDPISKHLRKSFTELPGTCPPSFIERFKDGVRRWTTTSELFEHALDVPIKDLNKTRQMALGRSLRALHWRRKKIYTNNGRIWAYLAPQEFIDEMQSRLSDSVTPDNVSSIHNTQGETETEKPMIQERIPY